jgi:hypothetical protein
MQSCIDGLTAIQVRLQLVLQHGPHSSRSTLRNSKPAAATALVNLALLLGVLASAPHSDLLLWS